MKRPDGGVPRWLAIVAVAAFLIYAANFLYFFVDDEAIPYVYAQNVLHGQGLSYSVLEGRVEGYSDFLHVWLSTLILAGVRAAGLPKIDVFFVGKFLSLSCGTAIVLLVSIVMRRCHVNRAGAAAGLAFIALAGPLAVWSCSSLEAVPFALATMALVLALIVRSDVGAAVAASVLVLERIDGFVYAAVLLGAFLAVADRGRRREMLLRVAAPVFLVSGIYHSWRVSYFHEVLPAPLASKVLYKLTAGAQLLQKPPNRSYVMRFLDIYGWPVLLAFAAVEIHAVRIGGAARAIAVAAIPLILYVSIVGDWMFGFRFFVPVLPLIALVLGASIGAIAERHPRIGRAAALAAIAWIGVAAVGFLHTYSTTQPAGGFLTARSFSVERFFVPYYGLYETARRWVHPREIVAYNQAGFLPFMLDLTNIDDLGICSRFHADLPTTDVYFTEVGRYVPLTNHHAVHAAHAYLLYRDARFVMARTDLLRGANLGSIPHTLLNGYYEIVATDAGEQNAIYRRTEKPAGPFLTDPSTFAENLAHVSYLRRASINGIRIDPEDYAGRFPFLHGEMGRVGIPRKLQIDLLFADADEQVREIAIEGVRADRRSVLRLTLLASDGHVVRLETTTVEANQSQAVGVALPEGSRAARLILDLTTEDGGDARASISDLRVQGQRPALARYITGRLSFARAPPPKD
jgi:hypothetical protein